MLFRQLTYTKSMSKYERYEPAAISPFEFADQQQQEDVLREATEQRLGVAENGQHFSGVHVNRAFGGQSLIYRPNSLFGSTANADQQYIASQYAAAFPEQGYLSLDLPAHGASDRLTKAQRREISKSDGSLGSVVNAQFEAALDLVPDLQNVILTGEALGELFAVEFAAQAAAKGIRVRHLFGFDPLGMEKRSPVALAGSYLGNAQKSRNQRKHQSNEVGEQALEDAFSKVFVPRVEQYGPIKAATQAGHAGLMARERTVVRLMLKKSPITRDTGMQALETALDTQPDMRADFVFAGRSVVGRLTEPVRAKLEAMHHETDSRVQFSEWPDDNQDIGLARHQPRLVTYVKDNL